MSQKLLVSPLSRVKTIYLPCITTTWVIVDSASYCQILITCRVICPNLRAILKWNFVYVWSFSMTLNFWQIILMQPNFIKLLTHKTGTLDLMACFVLTSKVIFLSFSVPILSLTSYSFVVSFLGGWQPCPLISLFFLFFFPFQSSFLPSFRD